MMPEIVVLCGIPCSGKSSWRNKYPHYAVICRDDVRTKMAGGNYNKYVFDSKHEDIVTAQCNLDYSIYTQREFDTVLDATHCKEAYLNTEIKRKPEGYTLRIIFFDCPLWKAYIRNVLRYIKTSKWIPFKIIRNMKRNYDKIDKKKYEQYMVHI